MPKTTVFELTTTLKAGSQIWIKGTTFNENTLPELLRKEVEAGSPWIKVVSFGEDFEGSDFDPDQTITVKEPKKKIVRKKKLK
jgi:hypothetical protein